MATMTAVISLRSVAFIQGIVSAAAIMVLYITEPSTIADSM